MTGQIIRSNFARILFPEFKKAWEKQFMESKKKKSREPKGCYKGGLWYDRVWYPTKLALWKAKGQVPLGTFKSRTNRGKSLSEALGDVASELCIPT